VLTSTSCVSLEEGFIHRGCCATNDSSTRWNWRISSCQAQRAPIQSQVDTCIGLARGTLYAKEASEKDKKYAIAIESWLKRRWITMGSYSEAWPALLKWGKTVSKCFRRKYGIAARRKRKKYVYPGKSEIFYPMYCERAKDPDMQEQQEVIFL